MPEATLGQLTAYLDDVKRDLADGAVYPHRVMEQHGPRLLAAVEKVLKLADELAATEFPDDEEMTTSQGAIVAAGIEARIHDGHFIRDSISAALLGEEKADGSADR